MEEIERIADRITVLRDGRLIGSLPASEMPIPKLSSGWSAARSRNKYPRNAPVESEVVLAVDQFSVYPHGFSGQPSVRDVSFSVRAGEVVGLGGLARLGRQRIDARNLRRIRLVYFRASRAGREGSLLSSPRQAIDAGVALLTNDRKATGLVLSLADLCQCHASRAEPLFALGLVSPGASVAATAEAAEAFDLRGRVDVSLDVSVLSGGNQQKVGPRQVVANRPEVINVG